MGKANVMMQTQQLPYFTPLLPWQQSLWQRLTQTAMSENGHLPHALLASGMVGIGKRAFVWRWVAWQLCYHRTDNLGGACGHCESCQWLEVGTHPDLAVLPLDSQPKLNQHEPAIKTGNKKSKKKAGHAKKLNTQTELTKQTKPRIKIDDIRRIQELVQQGSRGKRICVFDHADTMTLAAANALLKTLEEPNAGVQLILMTDNPSLLLPTIKSRVQQLPLADISNQQAIDYLKHQLVHLDLADLNEDTALEDGKHIRQLLDLSANAPLQAVSMAKSNWYGLRGLWFKTWLSLRTGNRSAVAASDYWQTQLNLDEFIQLTQIMLVDINRLSLGLLPYQQDMDYSVVSDHLPDMLALTEFRIGLQTLVQSLNQNIQEKLAYDEVLQAMAML